MRVRVRLRVRVRGGVRVGRRVWVRVRVRAFSSYFFIILAAGHIWKLVTLAYIPPTIAGLVLTYRGKYLTGVFDFLRLVCLGIKDIDSFSFRTNPKQ